MENRDTIKLLKECDAGSKMAVASLDDVLEKVENENMKKLLMESKGHHEKLGNESHALLNQYKSDEKEPNAMAKGMSKMKTNFMMNMKDSITKLKNVSILPQILYRPKFKENKKEKYYGI